MGGPSRFLSWDELACWNRLGRPFALGNKRTCAAGERIAPYPQPWRDNRAVHLAEMFDELRELLGSEPITVNSGYRTLEYNRACSGAAMSQHVQGRALDIVHKWLDAREVFALLKEFQADGKLKLLGGLGSYPTLVHVDIRPKINGHLATWLY